MRGGVISFMMWMYIYIYIYFICMSLCVENFTGEKEGERNGY